MFPFSNKNVNKLQFLATYTTNDILYIRLLFYFSFKTRGVQYLETQQEFLGIIHKL